MADVVFGLVHIIPWERIEEEVVFLVFLEFLFELRGWKIPIQMCFNRESS